MHFSDCGYRCIAVWQKTNPSEGYIRISRMVDWKWLSASGTRFPSRRYSKIKIYTSGHFIIIVLCLDWLMKFENERVLWPLLRVWFLLLFWRVCGVGEAHRIINLGLPSDHITCLFSTNSAAILLTSFIPDITMPFLIKTYWKVDCYLLYKFLDLCTI